MNVRQRLTRMPVTARLAAAAAGVGLCAGVLLPLGASASQTTAAQASQRGGPRLGHVFIIMLENHAADHVIGDPERALHHIPGQEVRRSHAILRRHPPQRAQLHRRHQRVNLVDQ